MLNHNQKQIILESILNALELPEYAYEKAVERYEDIGKWFSRKESAVCNNSPHISSQGSFRLGTAIRPINDGEKYDLDLSCKLASGITTQSHTQQMLKTIIGAELEAYRKYRGIKST